MEGDIFFLVVIWFYLQLEVNIQQMMDYYDICFENVIDYDNYFEFQQVLLDIGELLEVCFVLEDKLIVLVVVYNLSNDVCDNIVLIV